MVSGVFDEYTPFAVIGHGGAAVVAENNDLVYLRTLVGSLNCSAGDFEKGVAKMRVYCSIVVVVADMVQN